VTFPRIVNYLEGGSGKASRLIAADDQSAAIRFFGAILARNCFNLRTGSKGRA